MVGGYGNAVKYVEYVVSNWKSLKYSMGPSDAQRLPATPEFNKLLARWRIQTWWGRCSGVQSKRGVNSHAKIKAQKEKIKSERAELNSMILDFKAMASGEMEFDAERFPFVVKPTVILKPEPYVEDIRKKFKVTVLKASGGEVKPKDDWRSKVIVLS